MANQLRVNLRNASLRAVGLFTGIDSPISPRFLAASSPRDRVYYPDRLVTGLVGGRPLSAVCPR